MIDFRSDTVTTPTDEMRSAARDAAVGDDVLGEDPTVAALEKTAADLLGMGDSLYCPSGTMANQVAARTHTERGQEVICERESHVYKWELGGLAQLSGLQTRPLDGGDRGLFSAADLRSAYVEEDDHRAGTGLVTVENTHNARGGIAITPDEVDSVAAAAQELDVPVHLDGARLFNAAVARSVPAHRFTREVDSVMVSLSKGLGAPVGSVLCGNEDFIARARRNRKLFGGGMRQAGVIAAPGLVALENRDHLMTDHVNASRLAEGLSSMEGLSVSEPETNIVLLDVSDAKTSAAAFLADCEEQGVLGIAVGNQTIRFCTHRNVDRVAVETALDRIRPLVDG